jgi:hypothetical protein
MMSLLASEKFSTWRIEGSREGPVERCTNLATPTTNSRTDVSFRSSRHARRGDCGQAAIGRGTAASRRAKVAEKIHPTLFGRLDSADPAAIVERVARLETKLQALMESRESLLRAGSLEIHLIKRSARRSERSLELLPREFRLLENDTKVHPPLAVARWSAVGPGSIEIAHFAKVSGFIAACIWLIAQSPLTIMAALPEIEATVRSI